MHASRAQQCPAQIDRGALSYAADRSDLGKPEPVSPPERGADMRGVADRLGQLGGGLALVAVACALVSTPAAAARPTLARVVPSLTRVAPDAVVRGGTTANLAPPPPAAPRQRRPRPPPARGRSRSRTSRSASPT